MIVRIPEVCTVESEDKSVFEAMLQDKLREEPPDKYTTYWILSGFSTCMWKEWTLYTAVLTRYEEGKRA